MNQVWSVTIYCVELKCMFVQGRTAGPEASAWAAGAANQNNDRNSHDTDEKVDWTKKSPMLAFATWLESAISNGNTLGQYIQTWKKY